MYLWIAKEKLTKGRREEHSFEMCLQASYYVLSPFLSSTVDTGLCSNPESGGMRILSHFEGNRKLRETVHIIKCQQEV